MDARQFIAARKHGYRSGLEHKVSQYLDNLYIKYKYEAIKIEWEDFCLLESSIQSLTFGLCLKTADVSLEREQSLRMLSGVSSTILYTMTE